MTRARRPRAALVAAIPSARPRRLRQVTLHVLPLLLLTFFARATSMPFARARPVLSYDSNMQPVPEVFHKCEDVIRMCQAQCSDNPQCLVSCVACPHDARDMCWVLPDQCRLHSDG